MGQCLSLLHRVLESQWFVWVTQVNHIPREIGHDKHRDWITLQVWGWVGYMLGWGAGPLWEDGDPNGAARLRGCHGVRAQCQPPSPLPRLLLAAASHLQRGVLALPRLVHRAPQLPDRAPVSVGLGARGGWGVLRPEPRGWPGASLSSPSPREAKT